MKKTILNLFATAAIAFAGTAAFADTGDIWDIAPCNEQGVTTYPEYCATNGMAPSQKMYFKLRFLTPVGCANSNKWSFRWVGASPIPPELIPVLTPELIAQFFQPTRIGIFVSGKQTWATWVGYGIEGIAGNGLTDLVFEYEVQAGDFALPITLALQSGLEAVPMHSSTKNTSSIFVDGTRYSKDGSNPGWRLSFKDPSDQYVDAKWIFCENSRHPSGSIEQVRYWNLSSYDPFSEVSKGFFVKTIDFSSKWKEDGTCWREVHQNSRNCDRTPQLEALVAPAKLTTLYVWSLDEDAVVVTGNVRRVSMPDPENPSGPAKTYSVAEVTFQQDQMTSDFALYGVAQGGTARIVLSAYDHFSRNDASTGAIVDDYITVPVRCIEPLDPSVLIETDVLNSEATSDYGHYANRVYVKLSEPIPDDVTVRIVPHLSDGSMTDEEVAERYVRFSAIQDDVGISLPDASFPEVTLNNDNPEASFYVFCLRGDSHTIGLNTLEFRTQRVTGGGTIADADFQKCAINVRAQKPVIEQPEEDFEMGATAFIKTPVTIRVSDTYADLADTNSGYRIFYKLNAGKSMWSELEGTYIAEDGILYTKNADGTSSGELPMLEWAETGENIAQIYVKSPVSGNESRSDSVTGRKFKVYVEPSRSVGVETSNGQTEFLEGASGGITFKIHLDDQGNNTGSKLWAFLVCDNPVVTNEIAAVFQPTYKPFIVGTTNTTSNGKSLGLEIGKGKGIATQPNTWVSGSFKLLDGWNPEEGGLIAPFRVVLCTQEQYDPSKIYEGFESDTLEIKVDNVQPTVTSVVLGNGQETCNVSGQDLVTVIPMNIGQKFTLNVTDPGKYDLQAGCNAEGIVDTVAGSNKAFQVQWEFKKDGKPVTGMGWKTTYGDPAKNPLEVVFTQPGKWQVSARVKDKDMIDWNADQWTEGAFVFGFEVVNKPMLRVRSDLEYFENLTFTSPKPKIEVDLGGIYDSEGKTIIVELFVESKAKAGRDPGEIVLATNLLYFTSTDSQFVTIDRLDGTPDSTFVIKAKVVNPTDDGVIYLPTSQPVAEYYLTGSSDEITVINNEPEATFSPESNEHTNGWTTARKLNWRVIRDVYRDLDLTNVTVTIEAFGQTTTTNVCEGTSGFFEPDLSGLGPNEEGYVTITISDKDYGEVSRRWKFIGLDAKFLYVMANGPGATATSKASQKYAAQSGRGEGHAWVESATFLSENNFRQKWNCLQANSALIYGWGYKLANPVDNGWLDATSSMKRDHAIDSNGVRKTPDPAAQAEDVDGYYTYTDGNGLDSFLYGWILTQSGSDGNDTIALTIAPERAAGAAQAGKIVLPSKSDNASTSKEGGASFADTEAEAIFAKELLPTDNMGDINFDGIPDLHYMKYFSDSAEGGAEGEATYADLLDYSVSENNNPDGDYLPGRLNLPYVILTTNLADGVGFKAEWEIRGFDDDVVGAGRQKRSALNDAPIMYEPVSGVKPDVCYLDPDACIIGNTTTSTLSRVEYMAWTEFVAAHPELHIELENPETWRDEMGNLRWSPERPTDPTKSDTDDDGIPDGFEYYYWYRAHVGYINARGEHEYMTGRRYDPRNPGQGSLITSEEIESIFDPITPCGEAGLEVDTDNDGLPDVLECYIGTNPFDFDTDGDGLPDGWEIMIGGTDPRLFQSIADGVSDTMRNSDGDAMAITSPKREASVMPKPFVIKNIISFAVEDTDTVKTVWGNTYKGGDSDGVQWYVVKNAEDLPQFEEVEFSGTTLKIDGKLYAVEAEVACTTDLRLGRAYEAYELVGGTVGDTEYEEGTLCGAKVRLGAGRKLEEEPAAAVGVKRLKIADDPADNQTAINAAWIYGNPDCGDASGDFGFLAIARYKAPMKDQWVVAIPSDEREVCYLHYLVYQEFGFDPRTAWNATGTTASRWAKTDQAGQVITDAMSSSRRGGYANYTARTRPYTAYDEFLVSSFFVNNGCEMSGFTTILDTSAPYLAHCWNAFTTNPQGPSDAVNLGSAYTFQDGEIYTGYYGRNSVNGADTDGDGVPDGWELYVMSGPKANGEYVFANPYAGFKAAVGELKTSFMNPFLAAATGAETDSDADSDGLSEQREFSGTDCCAYYAAIYEGVAEATIKRREEQTANKGVYMVDDSKWLNKFFPTDPWNGDTDCDGLKDNEEGESFVYGDPADDGKIFSIPGGGLNPCSMDTDLDGLPDAWEKEFKGGKIFAGKGEFMPTYLKGEGNEDIGNPLEGYVDGMDGTVPDAYNVVSGNGKVWTVIESDGRLWSGIVDRDYDHDGLENWQEYLAGAMRCWRYDDPYTPFTAIPKDAYVFDEVDGGVSLNVADTIAKLSEKGWVDPAMTEEEFWNATLDDWTSRIYNPHLVTDTCFGPYFTRVTNAWDPAFIDAKVDGDHAGGAYYYLKNTVNGQGLFERWVQDGMTPMAMADVFGALGAMGQGPQKYISCSPISADTDKDGMDDYYELFHGMNPLLGKSGISSDYDAPCDIVFSAWAFENRGFSAFGAGETMNYWQTKIGDDEVMARLIRPVKHVDPVGGVENTYDFVAFPWLNGEQGADPDGDGLVNYDEALLPRMALPGHHSDPTPLWMTDSSYSNSLASLFFRMPTREDIVVLPEIERFADCDTYMTVEGVSPVPVFMPFNPDQWDVVGAKKQNWICSFEQNEGFDTDHDGTSDFAEPEGRVYGTTDPRNAEDPLRRQAMYFPGNNSALQTMPTLREVYPVARSNWNMHDDYFQTYTVECWVRPESLEDSVIVERAIWVNYSNLGDQSYMRKNFQLAIKDGKWYTKFDTRGTELKPQYVFSSSDAVANTWTHLAVTFDGVNLTLFVNGVANMHEVKAAGALDGVYPENGVNAFSFHLSNQSDITGLAYGFGNFWFGVDYNYVAIIVGASAKDASEGGSYQYLDITNAKGWGGYKDFFKGYIDEIRIWDGVRDIDKNGQGIIPDYHNRVRFSQAQAIENRQEIYKAWKNGKRRTMAGSDPMPAELRYHYTFDSVLSAAGEEALLKAPNGFLVEGGKPDLSRPEDWGCAWWMNIAGGYGSCYDSPCWVEWIHNQIAHLPFFDGTTADSMFWSENFCGATNGTFRMALGAEPVSYWTQMAYNGAERQSQYATPGSHHHLIYDDDIAGSNTTFCVQYEFAHSHLNQIGDDLLPLGGAFAKYCDEMWDGNGASSICETTGDDEDGDGLPAWWEEYARNHTDPVMAPGDDLDWETVITYINPNGEHVTGQAGKLYLRDLWKWGVYTTDGWDAVVDDETFRQTADVNNNNIPDWWELYYGFFDPYNTSDDKKGTGDLDNDGLSNYHEYLVSEKLGFGFELNPLLAKTDTVTLDYFRKVGSLYLGEMLTDHDLIEDWWERSVKSADYNADKWDALDDADEDHWTNFQEARYNQFSMGTLAQLVSHAVGDAEVLDAPVPTIRLTVRYNGNHFTAAKGGEEGAGGSSSKTSDSGTETGSSDPIDVGRNDIPNLVIKTYTDANMGMPDATYTITPGQTVSKSVYIGGWEDRMIHGTMTPGHIDLGSLDIKFAQVPQADMYSWTDPEGTHLARPYAEFKVALENYPNIVQNVQNFTWNYLETPVVGHAGATSDKAVTVARDSKLQKGYIAVYGERVGTVDLETGDFVFDMGLMNEVLGSTYSASSGESSRWSIKEAIFRIDYKAKVPSVQSAKYELSLARPDSGFVKGGINSLIAFYDNDGNGEYTAGEPMGVVRGVDVGWAGASAEIELTDMSAIFDRISVFEEASARGVFYGENTVLSNGVESLSNVSKARACIVPYSIRGTKQDSADLPQDRVDVELNQLEHPLQVRVVKTIMMNRDDNHYLHEGYFLDGEEFDLDWDGFRSAFLGNSEIETAVGDVTCVKYRIVYNIDDNEPIGPQYWGDTNTPVRACGTLIERRFEVERHAPVATNNSQVCITARPTFKWVIPNEEDSAARYGTSYTAFTLRVYDEAGKVKLYDSGYQRMPARDSYGVYSWTAPLYVGAPIPGNTGKVFENFTNYKWELFIHNAKFRSWMNGTGKSTFRMNVTGDRDLPIRVCYAGPAGTQTKYLQKRIHVQAFERPDFSGAPAFDTILADEDSDKTKLLPDYLDGTNANIRITGLNAGTYYLCAYIDTNGNGVRDEWESWGYLSGRDRATVASTKDIFNPIGITIGSDNDDKAIRQVFIEDCDTDFDWFPDVWEAEQNNGNFDREVKGPVTGDRHLIGINPELASSLTEASLNSAVFSLMAGTLESPDGVALMTGLPSAAVSMNGGAIQLKSTVAEGTLVIRSFGIDREAGQVVMTVDGEVADVETGDAGLPKLWVVDITKNPKVTIRVLHAETLAEKMTEVKRVDVDLTNAAAEVRVDVSGLDLSSGFYKVEVVE